MARVLLGLVLAWFGYHELVQPSSWTGYVPVVSATSGVAVVLALAHGWLLLMLAVALIAGIAPRVAAAAAAILLAEIVVWLTATAGLSDLTMRDLGVLGHILPVFGDRPLNKLDSPEEISTWEIALYTEPRGAGARPLSKTSARTCRKVLSFILGDAQAAGLILVNPATIRRKRGTAIADARAAAAEAAEEKQWTTALQALLIAERAALLAGRDEEFTQIITMHYTGMRWGEIVGLEAAYVRGASIRIWWQLAEVNGCSFGSRRSSDHDGRSTSPRSCPAC